MVLYDSHTIKASSKESGQEARRIELGRRGIYGSGGTSPTSGQSGAATVSTASSRLGSILVAGSGRTLYLFGIMRLRTIRSTDVAVLLHVNGRAPVAAGQPGDGEVARCCR